MKKVLVVMMAFVMGMAVTSCKQSAAPKAEGADSTAVATVEDPAQALKALIEKVQANGANWSVDEWKGFMKECMIAVSPMLKEVGELTASIQTKEGEEPDTAKIAQIAAKFEELSKKYEPMEALMSQLDSICKSYPNGKTVFEDEEYEEQLKKELGLPDM